VQEEEPPTPVCWEKKHPLVASGVTTAAVLLLLPGTGVLTPETFDDSSRERVLNVNGDCCKGGNGVEGSVGTSALS